MKKILSIASVVLFAFVLFARISKMRNKQVLNATGERVFQGGKKPLDTGSTFTNIHDFPKRIKIVTRNLKDGLYDSLSGKLITEKMYDEIGSFGSEGLVRFKQDEKYGFLDTMGNEIIPAIYQLATTFEEGVACVQANEKWGYINRENKFIIPAIYQSADGFLDGRAVVKFNNKSKFINHSGKPVIETKYDEVLFSMRGSDTIAKVRIGDRYFFIDKKGRAIGNANPGY